MAPQRTRLTLPDTTSTIGYAGHNFNVNPCHGTVPSGFVAFVVVKGRTPSTFSVNLSADTRTLTQVIGSLSPDGPYPPLVVTIVSKDKYEIVHPSSDISRYSGSALHVLVPTRVRKQITKDEKDKRAAKREEKKAAGASGVAKVTKTKTTKAKKTKAALKKVALTPETVAPEVDSSNGDNEEEDEAAAAAADAEFGDYSDDQ